MQITRIGLHRRGNLQGAGAGCALHGRICSIAGGDGTDGCKARAASHCVCNSSSARVLALLPPVEHVFGKQIMWRFYLSASAATFRCRRNQLWQIVLSPNGVADGYIALR